MHRFDLDPADTEPFPVSQKKGPGPILWPPVAPIRTALAGEIEKHGGILGQLPGATEKIRMNMGLRHRGDAEMIFQRQLLITINVPLRIEDQGFSGFLTPDQVRSTLGTLVQFGIVLQDFSEDDVDIVRYSIHPHP